MNLQWSRLVTSAFLICIGVVAALSAASTSALAQTKPAHIDSLKAFVGTWAAKAPGENSPFLVLKLLESNGKLTGTISHFKVAVVGNGRVTGTAAAGESPIVDLTVRGGDLGFVWGGDPPLRGGECKFVLEGTQRASLIIPASAEEMQKIVADNPGARGFDPVISMSRETEPEINEPTESVKQWEPTFMTRLINTAEAQYKFAHGNYADYTTLLRSGQLKNTIMRESTMDPRHFQSETDPLPGFKLRLWVSHDRSSYELSIRDKKAICGTNLFSNESGVIFEGRAKDCAEK